jgi:hypothetical protein
MSISHQNIADTLAGEQEATPLCFRNSARNNGASSHRCANSPGPRRLLSAFNTQRCLNPSISLGMVQGAFDESIRYLRDRAAFI